jgi:hypothetical protein
MAANRARQSTPSSKCACLVASGHAARYVARPTTHTTNQIKSTLCVPNSDGSFVDRHFDEVFLSWRGRIRIASKDNATICPLFEMMEFVDAALHRADLGMWPCDSAGLARQCLGHLRYGRQDFLMVSLPVAGALSINWLATVTPISARPNRSVIQPGLINTKAAAISSSRSHQRARPKKK